MNFAYQRLLRLVCQVTQWKIRAQFSNDPITQKTLPFLLLPIRNYQPQSNSDLGICTTYDKCSSTETEVRRIHNLLKQDKPTIEIELALDLSGLSLTEDLVLNVLKRYYSDWKTAKTFFDWVCSKKNANMYSPGSNVYNTILDILGKMKQFNVLIQVFGEMSNREGLVNERTYGIMLNRYCAAHKVEEATQLFYKRRQLGLELDLTAFQTLLRCLCRYRHVETAEFLFHSKQSEFQFPTHIKTLNIILNGWCVMGRFRDAKRFWNYIITSKKCKPDLHTYGIFINSLTKAGKLNTAVKLFQAMWEKGCDPDVAICNCIIDGLCIRKRIPEALGIFREMDERDCLPDVVTYNSLIKHLCKLRKMDKVYELLDEMEKKGGDCLPNARTYGYFLKSVKRPEEVDGILERMGKYGAKLNSDAYNLLLRLFRDWGCEEKVRSIWLKMERNGLGPDQRSYTIMIHGLYDRGRIEEAMVYFNEMTAKGMVAEPRTNLLVNAMNLKQVEKVGEIRDMGVNNRDLTKRN